MRMSASDVERGLQALYGSGETGHRYPRVSEVILLGSGFETDVFSFSLRAEGEDAVQELVARVYAGEGAAEKAAREFDVMGRLREAGYPVPRVLILQGEGSLIGRPFLIMERIRGSAMRWEFQEPLCRLMVQLHALEPGDIFSGATLTGALAPPEFVEWELSSLQGLLGRLEGGEPPSVREALAWLGARRSEIQCERLSVVHGDFHPNNVLLRDDGAPFVIDWSNARLADFRTDLAWARLLLQADARPDGGEAELRLYERLAGREVARIDYFEVMAATRLLLSVLISLRFSAARQGMRPEAEALMRGDTEFLLGVAGLLQKRTQLPMPDLEAVLRAVNDPPVLLKGP
jgi:aminoglycoside phosphotransferase (APT) family kinase protein